MYTFCFFPNVDVQIRIFWKIVVLSLFVACDYIDPCQHWLNQLNVLNNDMGHWHTATQHDSNLNVGFNHHCSTIAPTTMAQPQGMMTMESMTITIEALGIFFFLFFSFFLPYSQLYSTRQHHHHSKMAPSTTAQLQLMMTTAAVTITIEVFFFPLFLSFILVLTIIYN